MAYLFLAIGALVFVVCLNRLGVASCIRGVVTASRQAHGIISSARLTDEAKEVAIQKAAVATASSLAMIVGRVGLCLLISAAPVWLGTQTDAYSAADALAAASDWTFIVTASVIMTAALIVLR
jgi:uncharacterized membrane protein (DUF485 family)